jgi:hypothetical protein
MGDKNQYCKTHKIYRNFKMGKSWSSVSVITAISVVSADEMNDIESLNFDISNWSFAILIVFFNCIIIDHLIRSDEILRILSVAYL